MEACRCTGPNGEPDSGAVYVFTCSFESCQEETHLMNGEGVNDFVRTIKFFGQTILVGATADSERRRKLSQVDATGADGMV